MKTFTTPEIAAAARTTPRAIRLWEKMGLFGEVERRHNERQFTAADLKRAREISAASMAGMTLEEIKQKGNLIMAARISEATYFLHAVRVDMEDFDL